MLCNMAHNRVIRMARSDGVFHRRGAPDRVRLLIVNNLGRRGDDSNEVFDGIGVIVDGVEGPSLVAGKEDRVVAFLALQYAQDDGSP